ncbi:aldo-keto reductase family 1 member A1-like [Ptychodera flava]|uniref:aldo-keto reductase family 1 member A1-like n=1 Tax=Ptychodera flava TaxID=63121 RepID=UPI00396A29BF
MNSAPTTTTLNTGDKMPLVGLGSWKSEPERVGDAVKVAIDNGYRQIDCAAAYGNEAAIGAGLEERIGSTVKREEMFICSKLWNTKHAAKDVRPAFEQSLKDLHLDYLDLYLMHWPYSFADVGPIVPRYDDGTVMYTDVHYMETWAEMEKLVDEGLCKAIGLSNFNSKQISDVMRRGKIAPANLQVECHPYLNQKNLIQFCKERKIAVTAHSCLGSRHRTWHRPGDPDMLSEEKVLKIAEKHGRTPAQVMIRFQTQRGVAAIPKSVTPSRIIENIKVFDFDLDQSDIDILESYPERRMHEPFKRDSEDNIVVRDNHVALYPFNEPF